MFGIKLEEFSPGARRLLLCLLCIPGGVLLWFAFVVLKPVYYSALDTTLLPRDLVAAPATRTELAIASGEASLALNSKKKRKKGKEPDDASSVKASGKQGKAKKVGEKAGKNAAEAAGIGSETIVPAICGGAPVEFLPAVTMEEFNDCTSEKAKKDKASNIVKASTPPVADKAVAASDLVADKSSEAPPVKKSAKKAVAKPVDTAETLPETDAPTKDSAKGVKGEATEGSSHAKPEQSNNSSVEVEVQEVAVPAQNLSLTDRLDMIKEGKKKKGAVDIVTNASSEDAGVNSKDGTTNQRRLLHRTVGYTMSGTGCNKKHWTKVFHENDGSGPNIKKNVKPSEEQLVKCLNNIRHCNCETRKIAAQLDSIKSLPQKLKEIGKIGKGFKRYKTCAIVGNAGHLSLKKYGQYIDNHEFVVRFNVQPVQPYADYVGTKTSLRVANHRRSLALCCRGNFPEGKAKQNGTGIMIWYPGSQSEIMQNCKKRFPKNPIMNMNLRQAKILANAVKDMRKTLYRLGLGPFGEWRQLTSGGHAIMFMASICDSISMYGVTTYNAADKGGADHYGAALSEEKTRASAQTRARSGQKWHDWKGEKYVWRLLNAAGTVNICSM